MTIPTLVSRTNSTTACHLISIACIVPGANTAADPHDPTRLTNYADTKSDLIRLLRSPCGKYEIEQIYNTHNKKSTIAGGAATRTTVQNAPNTTQYIGSTGQYRLTISPRSTGQNDSTDHKTRMERLNKRLQEMQKADKHLELKQDTTRQRKQAFLLVHNSESYLQSVSTDQMMICIGMKASSIYEITGRPVPQTTNQTVGDVSNISLPEQHDLTSDVSRADTVADIIRPRPMPQQLRLSVCIRRIISGPYLQMVYSPPPPSNHLYVSYDPLLSHFLKMFYSRKPWMIA
jgi:hypothetical protein